ncbi:MAG: hypothetical protein ACOX52_13195 [Verrucomicrobiota bacterium]|jgi:hypothetical protein
MDLPHPDRLDENVTAPSAGGFPDPDGEVRLRMRLPFRTGSRQNGRISGLIFRLCNHHLYTELRLVGYRMSAIRHPFNQRGGRFL